MIYDNILDTIGNTPLVRLNRFSAEVPPTILGKVERFNPAGSVKERVSWAIIEDMEQRGEIKPGGIVVEATSGNMGVGVAMVCAARGYGCIIVMPSKMSMERERIIRAFGGKVVRTRSDVPWDHPESFLNTARRITKETPGAVMLNQFYNQVNPQIHYRTTAQEIWNATEGKIDAFVAGMGTGGTITGVGKFLKEKNPNIQIIGADPVGSSLKHLFDTGEMREGEFYHVEGIGEDFMPETLRFDHVDRMFYVADNDSFRMARKLARSEGIFAGGSTGTILCATMEYARTMGKDQTIVAMLCDNGERYLSKFYNEDWCKEMGFDTD
ncbi:MAG: cysteine synthase family protein [Candidatus Delongbacteria bacterium]|nr:cysteine synthase family protein [Candidatus Delongbacteria bacterium]